MGYHVRFQVSRLGESSIAIWTNMWSVTRVNSYMRPQVKVQRKPLSTAFKCALKQFIPNNTNLPQRKPPQN